MSEDIKVENESAEEPEQSPETESKASPKNKKEKKSKADKKAARAEAKENSRAQKEWEDSIVASKRVTREERRRKLTKAMAFLLVFALITTSIVYAMLLFIHENTVRITANSSSSDKSISLSADNVNWSPYLNAYGPDEMWDISYNPVYNREKIPTTEELDAMLAGNDIPLGDASGDNYIGFTFMLRNDGRDPVNVSYDIAIQSDRKGLEKAVRVMWAETTKNEGDTNITVYAALSNNPRLANLKVNQDRTAEQGYIEKIAYPVGADGADENLIYNYEQGLNTPEKIQDAQAAGFKDTEPFFSNDYAMQRTRVMGVGDILYVYISVWLEGSDLDCIDAALKGFVSLTVNFSAE